MFHSIHNFSNSFGFIKSRCIMENQKVFNVFFQLLSYKNQLFWEMQKSRRESYVKVIYDSFQEFFLTIVRDEQFSLNNLFFQITVTKPTRKRRLPSLNYAKLWFASEKIHFMLIQCEPFVIDDMNSKGYLK